MKGSLIMILVSFIYALMLMFQKHLFNNYPEVSFGEQNMFRGLCLMAFNYYFVIKQGDSKFYFNSPMNILLVKRVSVDGMGEILAFLSTGFLRVNTTSIFNVMYTVICSLVAGVIFNETVSRLDKLIIFAFFGSACLIIKPFFGEGEDTPLGIMIGSGSSLCFCLIVIYQRFLENKVSNFLINFYKGVFYFSEGLITHVVSQKAFNLNFYPFIFQLILGILCTLGSFFYITAISMGKVSYIVPFENCCLVFAIILGHCVLKEPIDFLDILGSFFILCLSIFRSIILIQEEEKEEINNNESEKALVMK